MTARSSRITLSLSLAIALGGCFGQEVRGRANGVEEIVRNARKNGAYTCAPKELALAEAHLRRTRDELDLGHYMPAREHISVADENARLAFKNSPPEKCAPKVVLPTPKVAVGKVDTDKDGLTDDIDKCPLQPEDRDGFEDEDGCPDLDNDKDGIPDQTDRCPNEPEDKDGWQDEDGCPDPDNDNDGIPDTTDKCKNEPEDVDGWQDEDGCPDTDNDSDTVVDLKDKCPNEAGAPDNNGCPVKYKLVVVTDQKIELKQMVFFATDKTKILPKSFPLLNDVAQALKDRSSIHVRIEGHTDSRGSRTHNLKLSQGRAASVRTYLIGRGIAPERMESVGYGPDKPIADNRTRAGRAENRRVEFFITKQ